MNTTETSIARSPGLPTSHSTDVSPIDLRDTVIARFGEEIDAFRIQFKGALWKPNLPSARLAKGLELKDERQELRAQFEKTIDPVNYVIEQFALAYLIEKGKTAQICEFVKRDIGKTFIEMKGLEQAIWTASGDKKLNSNEQRILHLTLAVRRKLAEIFRIMTESLENPEWASDTARLEALVKMFYERLNSIQYFANCAYQDFLIMRSEQIAATRAKLKDASIHSLVKIIHLHKQKPSFDGVSAPEKIDPCYSTQPNDSLELNKIALESIRSMFDLSVETGISYPTLMRYLNKFEKADLLEERPVADRHNPNRKSVGERRNYNPEFFEKIIPLLFAKFPKYNWSWCYVSKTKN